jgi:hypothetical protein
MRCADIAARLANPRKSDDLQHLEREYADLIKELRK